MNQLTPASILYVRELRIKEAHHVGVEPLLEGLLKLLLLLVGLLGDVALGVGAYVIRADLN